MLHSHQHTTFTSSDFTTVGRRSRVDPAKLLDLIDRMKRASGQAKSPQTTSKSQISA